MPSNRNKSWFFLCNPCVQRFMLDIRNQDIIIRQAYATDIMDVDVFTAISSLFVMFASEKTLWIDLRQREASSNRLVTRRTSVWELHATDPALGAGRGTKGSGNMLDCLAAEDSEHARRDCCLFAETVEYSPLQYNLTLRHISISTFRQAYGTS